MEKREMAREAKRLMLEEMALRANIARAPFESMKEMFRMALEEVVAARAVLRLEGAV